MTKLTLQDSTLYDNEPKETSKASKEMNAVDALRCQYENGFVNCLHLTDEENAALKRFEQMFEIIEDDPLIVVLAMMAKNQVLVDQRPDRLEKKAIETGLSDGSIQGDDLVEKSQRMGAINDLLDEKEMRWLELSELS